ncbi:MAG: extracellular solute-binding protein [Treponema sp.]|nr:extracellular solute-binding protein [Treponema sp.]
MAKYFRMAVLLAACTLFFFSCREESQERIVIWTSCAEFAQYTELFNSTHPGSNAVIVYKENPAQELPPAKDELPPDIVIGSWLRTDKTHKQFKSLDYLFDRQTISSSMFYTQLLDAGKVRKNQYLLPVSFNLPAVIFADSNSDFITENYTLTLDQIKAAGLSYNEKDKKDSFSRIGFLPSANDDFLYLTTKLYGVDFREEKGQITWSDLRLRNAVSYDRDWINNTNGSAQDEQDFAYKYLFMPDYRQVTSGRTLLAYTTSNKMFGYMKGQELNIDYRWIKGDGFIPIEDSFLMTGIYAKARNEQGATEFISWFFDSENQKAILERKIEMELNNEMFGIADGFSALRDITEHILPIYYNQLLTNLPPAQLLRVPQKLPARWDSYKSVVVEPYLNAAITTDEKVSISDYEAEWRKKVFDN